MATSIREALESAISDHKEAPAPDAAAQPSADQSPATETQSAAPAAPEAKPAPAAAAPKEPSNDHDPEGKFAKGNQAAKKREEAAAAATTGQQPLALEQSAKPRPQRPQSWKKDHWEAFDKIATENPALAEYLNQREREYATGVSTYKQEWDRVKPLLDAITPFQADIAASGMPAHEHVARLFGAHQALARGTPEMKLALFQKLANDYQVPLANLFQQGQDGQWYMRQVQQPQTYQPQQPQLSQADIDARVQAALNKQQASAELQAFANAAPEKYQNFEAVRETMAQLLDARLADGLEAAYNAALRMPQHAELFNAMQQQQREQDEARQAEERRKAAEAARRKAISPRTGTPTAAQGAGDAKGLRAVLSEQFDMRAGRV